MRSRGTARRVVAALVLVVLPLLAGCAVERAGRPVAASTVGAGIDPAALRGTDGGDDDRLSAAVLRDLEGWWAREFPAIAGGVAFTPPAGSFSVDPETPGPLPPCVDDPTEVEGNAFYCPRADALVLDRSALVPVLRQEFGDAAVVVVLAHEYGHAVQRRLLDPAVGAGPGPGLGVPGSRLLPTILLEAQADCYGAGFLRAVHDGRTPNLRTGDAGVDAAMAALVTFRDPVGTGQDDGNAHGNAFDRVTSFQLGYERGPAPCAAMSVANRTFTQRAFSTLSDEAAGGNLPLADLVASVTPDLDRFYGDVVRGRGLAWSLPALPAPPADVHREVGDFATVTLLASRAGLATVAALGRPTSGPEAGRTALCLAGAYTNSVGAPGSGFELSPGDLDEAVGLLLRSDDAARATDGAVGAPTGYGRIADFRRGVLGGAGTCLA